MPVKMEKAMIAPCGVNCSVCSAHLNIKLPCPGCRAPQEQITRKSCRNCAKKSCAFDQDLQWCFECARFPCAGIKDLSRRYTSKYGVDLVQNGLDARSDMDSFLEAQRMKFTCRACGGAINRHRKYCSECGKMSSSEVMDSGPFYHGTKADLKPGDLLGPGYNSNYGERKKANFVYMAATMDAAVWGAELAVGDGSGRIYIVEPTGAFENDPNLTDKKFPGNPTRSYRTREPLRVVGEVPDWEGHSPEVLQQMIDHLTELKRLGIEAINE